VGQALEVLTVEFSNATLGSQSSKHAEAFRRGQKMAAVADVVNIVLEEVSTGRTSDNASPCTPTVSLSPRPRLDSLALHDRTVGLLVPPEAALVTLA
jgi:hypothetical protein